MAIQVIKKDNKIEKKTIDGIHYTHFLLRYYIDGKPKKERKWFRNKEEANAYIFKRKNQIIDDDGIENLTWGQGWDIYKNHPDQEVQSDNNMNDKKVAIDYIKTLFEGLSIEATTKKHIVRFMEYLESKELSGRTINKHVGHLKCIARWLEAHEKIDGILFERVPKIKHIPKEKDPFTPEELPQYLGALNEFAKPLAVMLALTGARVSSIANIKESDIMNDVVNITEKGKLGGVKSVLILSEEMDSVIKKAINLKAQCKIDNEYIFVNHRGNKWTAKAFHRSCTAAWEKAELPYRTPHCFRHTFGTEAGRSEFNTRMIQAGMGHKDERSAKPYTHLNAQDRHKVGEAVRGRIVPHIKKYIESMPKTCPKES